jgi:hypothetical protein
MYREAWVKNGSILKLKNYCNSWRSLRDIKVKIGCHYPRTKILEKEKGRVALMER